MAFSQREQIRALIDELESISPKGTFGPEPPDMTPEVADKLHRLGSLIRDYGTRERANHREREKQAGRKFNRSEVLDDDAEDAAHQVLSALHELRRCSADEVERWRHIAHTALEQCGVAITDPEHRADAGMSRELRPRSRELVAARRGDAEERRRLEEHHALQRRGDAEAHALQMQALRDQHDRNLAEILRRAEEDRLKGNSK